MAIIQVRMPDGSLQSMSHPDNWSDEQITDAIHKNFTEDKGLKAPENDSFGKKLLRYGVQDPLLGAISVSQNIHNAPYNIASLFSQKLASHMPTPDVTDYSELFGRSKNQQDLADKLIQFAPDLATSLALPETKLGSLGKAIESIPKAGKYIKTALGNALSQGGYAATQTQGDPGKAALEAGGITAPFSALSKAALSGSPLLKTLSRGTLGVGGGLLGYHGAKSLGSGDTTSDIVGALGALAGIKGLNPRESALKGVEGTEYKPYLEASQRLGLPYVTPAEASGNPFTGAEQGTMGKTEKGAQLLYQAGQKRSDAEKNTINNFLDQLYKNERDSGDKNRLYEIAKQKEVPSNELIRFRGNPSAKDSGNEIFKDAESKLLNDPAYREALKGVSRDSVGYLDMVKRTMGDMIDKIQGKSPYKESLIKSTQDDLIKTMDNIAPEYKDARSLAEREITRRNIENAFNKKEMTGTAFGKFLDNKKQYSALQNNVRNVPGAQQQLDDMKLVFKRLINIPTAKSAEALSRSSMTKDRATSASAIRMLQEVLSGGGYDKARVNLITNPKWADELSKLKGISNTDKFIGKSYNLLGKAGAQSIAQ